MPSQTQSNYQTPDWLAAKLVSLAFRNLDRQLRNETVVSLEPTAGIGNIAAALVARISPQYCLVDAVERDPMLFYDLSKRFPGGKNTIKMRDEVECYCTDVVEFSRKQQPGKYSVIAANPPYTRAEAYPILNAIAPLLREGGVMALLLPSAFPHNNGFHDWLDEHHLKMVEIVSLVGRVKFIDPDTKEPATNSGRHNVNLLAIAHGSQSVLVSPKISHVRISALEKRWHDLRSFTGAA